MYQTILNDLHVPCRCAEVTGLTTIKVDMFCNRCDGLGRVHFRPHCRLYVDMDGVQSDFDGCYESKFGHHPASVDDDTMWANINGDPGFWIDQPVLPGAAQFMTYVEPLNPMVLTACPPETYEDVARCKKYWERKHIPGDPFVLPVRGGSMKPFFMHNVGDILIDDFQKNIDAWEAAGGIGILHTGDFEQTRKSLITILRDKHLNRH